MDIEIVSFHSGPVSPNLKLKNETSNLTEKLLGVYGLSSPPELLIYCRIIIFFGFQNVAVAIQLTILI